MSNKKRHSFIAFYPDNWSNGVHALSRLQRSAYFDLCCFMWEFAKPVPLNTALGILRDLPDPALMIDQLIDFEKIERLPDGSLSNSKAIEEGKKAFAAWRALSAKGKAGAEKRWSNGTGNARAIANPMQNKDQRTKKEGSVPDGTGAVAPDLGLDDGSFVLPDPTGFGNKADWFFHPAVVGFVRSGGASERATRSFIGRLRSLVGDPTAAKRILEAVEAKPSDPVAWLRSRLPKGTANTGVNRRSFDDVDYGESGRL